MKKSIPKVRERESEASILGNDREREFPLTPDHDKSDKAPDTENVTDMANEIFVTQLAIGFR